MAWRGEAVRGEAVRKTLDASAVRFCYKNTTHDVTRSVDLACGGVVNSILFHKKAGSDDTIVVTIISELT